MNACLIIDDDMTFCDVLVTALQRRGYAALQAHTAADARSVLQQQPVDSVVLDLRLATDNGLELIPTLCRLRLHRRTLQRKLKKRPAGLR